MDVIVRAAGEPGADLSGFVGCVIVHDDMDIERVGDRPIDLLEEVEELGCAVPFVAFANHEAGRDVERCEQRFQRGFQPCKVKKCFGSHVLC